MHQHNSNLSHRFHSANVIQLASVLIKHADHVLSKQWSLSYAQFKVLAILAHHADISQQGLAECLELTPAAISRLTESLVSKKLINRQAKANNRRQNVLTISPAGTKTLTEALAMFEDLEKKLYGELSKDQLVLFEQTLRHILGKISY